MFFLIVGRSQLHRLRGIFINTVIMWACKVIKLSSEKFDDACENHILTLIGKDNRITTVLYSLIMEVDANTPVDELLTDCEVIGANGEITTAFDSSRTRYLSQCYFERLSEDIVDNDMLLADMCATYIQCQPLDAGIERIEVRLRGTELSYTDSCQVNFEGRVNYKILDIAEIGLVPAGGPIVSARRITAEQHSKLIDAAKDALQIAELSASVDREINGIYAAAVKEVAADSSDELRKKVDELQRRCQSLELSEAATREQYADLQKLVKSLLDVAE